MTATPKADGPKSGRRTTVALLACIVGFSVLGTLGRYVSEHGETKEPVALAPAMLPRQVGDWHYVGEEPGWLKQAYPVGHTLFRYEREDGAAMLVTAAVGQERYGAFSNIAPLFLQQGHEMTMKIRESVPPPGSGKAVPLRVTIYRESEAGGPFAFAGLYWNGRHLSTSLAAVKVGVTLKRAMGRPDPTVAVYFQRPMSDTTESQRAADEIASFALAFEPTITELRDAYARS
jgi:hypothetical protein